MASDFTALTPVRAAQMRARRSPRLIALGVLLASLGGLGGVWILQQGTRAEQVVVVQRGLARGEVVRAGDLGVVSLNTPPGLKYVPAAEMGDLLGRHALVDLPQGSLVGEGSVGIPGVPTGQAVVGLKVAAGRVPILELPQGTRVQLVQISDDKSPGQAVVEATIVTAPRPLAEGGAQVLDVAIAGADARLVADLAARELLAVVRKAA